jgi:hypothetical protein
MRSPVLASFLLLAAAGSASAQTPYQGQSPYQGTFGRPPTNPYVQPAVSPYLNLVRPGSPPGLNYYDLVRPQVETQNSLHDLREQVQAAHAYGVGNRENAAAPLTTGHPTYFGALGQHFGAGTPPNYFSKSMTAGNNEAGANRR